MALTNVPTLYQQIKKGSEGAQEFARIVSQLIYAEDHDKGGESLVTSDAAGDYKGVDLITKFPVPYRDYFNQRGYQFKFFPSSFGPNEKHQIKESLKKAIEKFPEIDSWVLVTPEDFNKFDREWFEQVTKEYNDPNDRFEISERWVLNMSGKRSISFRHIGHTSIINLALSQPHIGEIVFPELFKGQFGKLALTKVAVDTIRTNWYKSGFPKNTFELRTYYNGTSKSNELLFDFQFKNNSQSIYHLHKIHIKIIDTWTIAKGPQLDDILLPGRTIPFEIDFTKKVNTIDMDEKLGGPMIFKPLESKRFDIHFVNFTRNCPGNMALLEFEFVFDNGLVIKSKEFGLDFLKS